MDGKKYFVQGQRAFIIGDLELSVKMFSKALEWDYSPISSLLSRGTVSLLTRDLSGALRDFSSVLEIDENNERAWYYRGITHLKKQEYSHAAADLDKALSCNPQRGTAYFARGVAWTMLERMERAAADFEQAVALADIQAKSFLKIFGNDPELLDRFMKRNWGSSTSILTQEEIDMLRNWL